MNEATSDHVKPSRTILGVTLFCALIAAITFTVWPEIDLYAASIFYEGKGRFYLIGNPLGTIPRLAFRIFFVSFCAVILFGLFYTIFKKTALLGLGIPHWAYLVACIAIGPGILTNTILKDNWGRARPIQTEQFGSSGKFTPALVPSTACERNCSFVSGESSSIYMVFFSLALLLSAWRKALFAGGIVIGGLAGLVRMGMGGAFPLGCDLFGNLHGADGQRPVLVHLHQSQSPRLNTFVAIQMIDADNGKGATELHPSHVQDKNHRGLFDINGSV